MSYVAPTTLKKNSISTTITSTITADEITIPIADASVAYDASGNLITAGWVINANKAIAQSPEEITVSACSVAHGVGGPANLTGVRAVDYDVNTGGTAQGAAYAWPAGTTIQVNFSIGIYNALTAALNWLNSAIPVVDTVVPVVDGVATIGTHGKWADGGHIHPTDTSRASTSQALDTFGATTDVTTNDATTTKHGLLQKVVAGASSGIMNFLCTKYGETVSSWRALFDSTVPTMDGSAATGSADTAARRDHVHASDTSRAPTASPTFTGTVTIPSANDSLVLSGTPPPNGSLLIGDGTGFRNAVLTAGSNVTITNASGQITIAAAPGGVTFSGVSGTTQQAAVNNGYIPLNASLTTITLPATAAVGDVVAITGYGSGLWKLAQNASQLIYFNSLVTTTGTGGSIAATHYFDTVVVRCVVANTTWVVENAVGNLDVI